MIIKASHLPVQMNCRQEQNFQQRFREYFEGEDYQTNGFERAGK